MGYHDSEIVDAASVLKRRLRVGGVASGNQETDMSVVHASVLR
jgi:hypothetical protein